MAHVFISYAHKDKHIADWIKDALERENFLTWTDNDISPGEKWSQAIDNAIKNSFVLLVIMTEAARSSEYVTYEWSFALGSQIPVIAFLPFKMEIHPRLNELQYIDYDINKLDTQSLRHQNLMWNKLIKRLKELGQSTKAEIEFIAPVEENKNINTDIDKEDLADLFNDLSSEDGKKRKNAATLLGDLYDERAVPYLNKALDDKRWIVRAEAALALGKIGSKKAVAALLRTFQNSKAKQVRINTIWALGAIGDEKAVPSLYTLFESSSIGKAILEQEFGVQALGEIRTYKAQVALAKIAHNNHCALSIRKLAIEALAIPSSDEAGRELFLLLNDENFEIQVATINALETIGTEKARYYSEEWMRKQNK